MQRNPVSNSPTPLKKHHTNSHSFTGHHFNTGISLVEAPQNLFFNLHNHVHTEYKFQNLSGSN